MAENKFTYTGVIVGYSVGMLEAQVELYVRSALDRTNATIILMSDQDYSGLLEEASGRLRVVRPPSSGSNSEEIHSWGHLVSERFLHLLEIIETDLHPNDLVALTDTRDVIFQADPFVELDSSCLYVAEEDDSVFLSESDNTFGLSPHLSDVRLNAIRLRRTLCVGTLLGSAGVVIQFLMEYKILYSSIKCLKNYSSIDAIDQGLLNLLVYDKDVSKASKVDYKVMPNGNLFGTIGVLLSRDPARISIGGGYIQVRGRVPAIVHQYDRSALLSDFYKNIFQKKVN